MRSKSTRLSLLLFLPLLLGVQTAYVELEAAEKARPGTEASNRAEVMLFPDGRALQGLAFGYRNFLSNILWFKTINYFGKHYRGDKNYKWLAHMCKLVFELDAKARHVPEFCGLMLAWEANDARAALVLLDKAVEADPSYWRYYYYRGITHILFFQDPEKAKDDFHKGSQAPDAPVFMTRLATKTLANLEDPETAIAFLRGMVRQAQDPHERAALEEHLKQTIHDRNIEQLETMVADYIEKKGQPPGTLAALVKEESLLADPFGGTYYWDAKNGEVRSTSGREKGTVLSDAFMKKTEGNPLK